MRKRFVIICLGCSIVPLLSAYCAEYIFSIIPCKLCIYQRTPYWVILISSLWVFFTGKYYRVYWTIVLLSLISSIGLSGFHWGIENNWWEYEGTCIVASSAMMNFEQYKAMIEKADLVACNIPAIMFLGISMSGWNLIYSIACMLFMWVKTPRLI